MTTTCYRNTLFESRKSNPVAEEVDGAVPLVSKSKEAGRCRTHMGHKAVLLFMSILWFPCTINTSLILVPFLLLREDPVPASLQKAETHRTQACLLHIQPALWLVIFQFFTIMSNTEVSRQLTSQASLKHVPALNFKLSLFLPITVSIPRKAFLPYKLTSAACCYW